MLLLPVLAIILPLVGAGGTLGLSLVPRARPYARYIALMAAGLTTILVVRLTWMKPVMVIPSLWQPSLLFGDAPALRTEVMMQPLALALALVTCSAMLVELSRTEESPPRFVAVSLALLSAGLVALWAANLLTMIIGWAIYDLLQAAGHIAAGGSARTAVRSLIFGGLATLLLWGGALLPSGGVGGKSWVLMTFSSTQMTLWAVAGILRLCVYPFHLSTPDDLDTSPSLVTLLLLGPVVGWGLWLRLTQANGGSVFGNTWVPVIAGGTLALGGFLAWSCDSTRRMLPWIGMEVTGAVLLTVGLAGESATAVIAAGSVAWVLGIAVLFLGGGLQREAPWRSIPALIGALALLGMPLTLGFVAETTLIEGLTKEGHLGWGGALFFGNLFLVPSLVRWLLSPSSSPLNNQRWLLVARGVGLGLLALLLIVAGLHPPLLIHSAMAPSLGALFTMPGVAGWLLWAISLAGGGVLAWQEGNLRPKIEPLLSAAHDLLRLEWLYDVVVRAIDRGLSALRAADEIIGGAGALLWSWSLFLLILLVWGGL